MTAIRYDVDPSQVRALATGLRRVHSAIEELGRLAAVDSADLGSPLVAQGVHDVGRSWTSARAQIGQELDLLAQAADVAAEAYTTVDGNVVAALGSGGGPGPAAAARQHAPSALHRSRR
jgi:hypothetical protein